MKLIKCSKCGKILAVVKDTPVPTMCCGQPMEEMIPNTADGAVEKHIPVYQVNGNICHVEVGSVEHPMLENHYIEWIMLQTNFGNQRKMLKPSEKPVADFALLPGENVVAVLEHCNLHGLYKA